MNEADLKQLFAELINAQGEAMAMLVTAACQQLDAKQLRDDLKAAAQAQKRLPSSSPLAARLAAHAVAAADAQCALQVNALPERPTLAWRAARMRHKQAATDLALDALIGVLAPEVQKNWCSNLRTLALTQKAANEELADLSTDDKQEAEDTHAAAVARWHRLIRNRTDSPE